jgi:YVTN family beta-propeller protein
VEVAFSRDGAQAYVANAGSGSLSVIDTDTHRVTRQIPAGRSPVAVAVTKDGKAAYVADEVGTQVLAIATDSGKATAVNVGAGPFDVAIGPDGRYAYSADLGPGNVSVIDTGSKHISATIALGPPGTDPFNLAVTDHAIYVTNQGANTLSPSSIPHPARSSRRSPWAPSRTGWR